MNEILIHMSKVIDKKLLADLLIEKCQEFKKNTKNKESVEELKIAISLMGLKLTTEDKSVEQIVKDFEERKMANSLFGNKN